MKAAIATAILAFCANNAIAAPLSSEALSRRDDCAGKAFPAIWPPSQAELACSKSDFERVAAELPDAAVAKRDPALPALGIGAKLGARIGARIGKELFFGDKRDLSKRDSALPALGVGAKLGAKVGARIGKELFLGDRRDLSKRALPALGLGAKLGAKLGARIGARIGKELFFGDEKRDLSEREVEDDDGLLDLDIASGILQPGSLVEDKFDLDISLDKRDPFINDLPKNIDPTKDDPLNSFEDGGIIGEREAEPFIKDFIGNINPLDDDPLDPFDDEGIIGKRQLEFLPESIKGPLRNFANNIDPNDDNPLNPFDDPGMIGKRDAEAEPFIGDLIDKIDPNDDSSLNPLDGLIF